jgi:hypothetical protein
MGSFRLVTKELSHDSDSQHEFYRLFRPCALPGSGSGRQSWKLAFSVGLGQKPRIKTITARSTLSLVFEIKAAKKRFGLPEDAPVVCCYEAGRDGFWLHRFLLDQGVQNQVVDSSSIEVNRRRRRAKSDSLDAAKLVEMLIVGTTGSARSGARSMSLPSSRRISGSCTGRCSSSRPSGPRRATASRGSWLAGAVRDRR